MVEAVRYPIGQQDFRQLREMGFLYIDKTHFIKKIVDGGQYYFLARPRRFDFAATDSAYLTGK